MGAAVTLVDETTGGRVVSSITLELVRERITARELIERRVRHEVARHNDAGEDRDAFRGLVHPSPLEAALNGPKASRPRRGVDADAQVAIALEAFGHHGFLLLVGDHQVERLDEEIVVRPGLEVSFLKLVPLVGG